MTATEATSAANTATALDDIVLHHRVEQFLFREARLADDSDYSAWLALFADDATFWVPRGRADYNPTLRLSYINDNRARLETRVRQLETGVRWAQSPPSTLARAITNVSVTGVGDDGTISVASNVVIREYAGQGAGELRTWAGRVSHELQPDGDSFLIRSKIVELVGSERSLPTLGFLL